jgi:nucleoside-diphosphate-sugar epimerase
VKILVAGGGGFIGSVLAPLLQEHGYEADVADLLWFGNHLPKDARVFQCDLFSLGEKDLRGYEQIVFLAGLSNDPMAELDPAMNFIENGALPSYLAFVAKKAGARRFVYASTCSVYGYTVNELFDESQVVTCAYPYGISKLQGERGVMQLQDESFSVIALRQGTVCGYSPRMRFDLVVNTMFKNAVTEDGIVVNNPAIWRPLIDVRDASSAFLRAIQADYSISGIFNIALDNFTVGQVGDLVKEEVEELTGRKIRIIVKQMRDFRNYKVSCDKARTYLGFLPKHSIGDMVKDLYAHIEEYGDFSKREYYNIEVFKTLRESRR